MNWKQRLEPFLVLIEARYLPLLMLALPQAYAVALWLSDSNEKRPGSDIFSVIGAAAFEFGYVGSIAWAESDKNKKWFALTAFAALAFSVAVSIKVYIHEDYWAILHSGFPVVAFCYTMLMHLANKPGQLETSKADKPKQQLVTSAADSSATLEDVQAVLLEEAPPQVPVKLADMTPEQRSAFYKQRAAKGRQAMLAKREAQ